MLFRQSSSSFGGFLHFLYSWNWIQVLSSFLLYATHHSAYPDNCTSPCIKLMCAHYCMCFCAEIEINKNVKDHNTEIVFFKHPATAISRRYVVWWNETVSIRNVQYITALVDFKRRSADLFMRMRIGLEMRKACFLPYLTNYQPLQPAVPSSWNLVHVIQAGSCNNNKI